MIDEDIKVCVYVCLYVLAVIVFKTYGTYCSAFCLPRQYRICFQVGEMVICECSQDDVTVLTYLDRVRVYRRRPGRPYVTHPVHWNIALGRDRKRLQAFITDFSRCAVLSIGYAA